MLLKTIIIFKTEICWCKYESFWGNFGCIHKILKMYIIFILVILLPRNTSSRVTHINFKIYVNKNFTHIERTKSRLTEQFANLKTD